MNERISFIISNDTANEIRNALAGDDRARLLTTIHDGEDAYTQIARFHPSAAILNLDDKRESTLVLTQRVTADCPDTMVICASADC